MNVHHYIAIALKIFSITLVVYSLRFISPLIESLQHGTINGVVVGGWFALLNLLTIWAIAAFVWLFPLTLAKSFLKSELDRPVELLPTPSIFTIIIASIGLYTLSNGVIDIVYWSIYLKIASGATYEAMGPEATSGMAATILEVLVGLLLVLKCRTIAGYINQVSK